MEKPKILVVGSFVMDQFASTGVVPNEGETVLGLEFSKAPGGKGANQAVQAARLGAKVDMFGKLGFDSNGQEMFDACRASGVGMDYVARDESQPSGCSVVILEVQPDGQTKNRIIVIPGANLSITVRDAEFLKNRLSEYDLVMLQLEIPMEINELVAAWASELQVPVMLNPAPSAELSDDFLSHLTYISPNEHEAQDLSGIRLDRGADGEMDMGKVRAAAEVLQKRGAKNVLITLGDMGAAYLDEDGRFTSVPAAKGIRAVDPTAAGDSFVAAFCYGMASGWDGEKALSFAAHTAGLTVTGKGALPSLPTIERVTAFMASLNEDGTLC